MNTSIHALDFTAGFDMSPFNEGTSLSNFIIIYWPSMSTVSRISRSRINEAPHVRDRPK